MVQGGLCMGPVRSWNWPWLWVHVSDIIDGNDIKF